MLLGVSVRDAGTLVVRDSGMDATEHIVSLRDHFAQYHNHKESMAWFGAAFIYTAQAFVWTQTPHGVAGWPWADGLIRPVLSLLVFALGYLFVVWQLKARQTAAAIVNACVTVEVMVASGMEVDSTPTSGLRASSLRVLTWGASRDEPSAYMLPRTVRQRMARPRGAGFAGALTVIPMFLGVVGALGALFVAIAR